MLCPVFYSLLEIARPASISNEAMRSTLIEWATNKLASYQMPRFYRAVDRFELTPSERIKKPASAGFLMRRYSGLST